jgi:AcrR family transcriptional regulator
LLSAGRAAFLKVGFFAASNDEIAAAAGLTRGALHYRFGDKRGLFVAVIRREVQDLAARLYSRTMAASPDEKDELRFGGRLLLDELTVSDVRALVLGQAAAVLTAEEWASEVERAPLQLIEHALGHWISDTDAEAEQVGPYARLLWGAILAAVRGIVAAAEPKAALEQYAVALERLATRLVRQAPVGP